MEKTKTCAAVMVGGKGYCVVKFSKKEVVCALCMVHTQESIEL